MVPPKVGRRQRNSPGIFVSPSLNGVVKNEPVVKQEPFDDDGRPVSDDEQIGVEAEGLLAEHEGVEYYEDEGFKIKQVKLPLVVNRLIVELYNLSNTKYLKLDPEYQREVVWDENRSSGLIASIFQGYFIPPIIFNVIPEEEIDEKGNTKIVNYRICVDGKQRLTSVKRFIEGEIGVVDSSSPPKKWFYSHPRVNGEEKISNHNILPEATKNFFRQRTFCCYEYEDLQESVEENMFQLVQRGMPLTPAERMRALSTSWATFGKQFEADYPRVVNLTKQSRASGFRSVVTIFAQVIEVLHPSGNKRTNREGVGQKPVLQANPQVLTKLLCDAPSLTEGVKAKIKGVFDKFQELVSQSTQNSTNKLGFTVIRNSAFDPAPDFLSERGVGHVKTFSPLELLATAILLLVHKGSRTTKMLLGDVKEMRHYLRENHKDLRLNNGCWMTTWEYIETVMIQQRGGHGAVRRRKDAETPPPLDEEEMETDDSGDGPEDIVGPTTARQRAVAAKNGAIPTTSSNPAATPRYFASATPRGALADPNAPAFKAFENPNPLAARKPVSVLSGNSSAQASSEGKSSPLATLGVIPILSGSSEKNSVQEQGVGSATQAGSNSGIANITSPRKRTLTLDLGESPGASRSKSSRQK